jgi:hypothetical protein
LTGADVILTGLPRAGLTVVSALIDSLPDTVCLNAPWWQVDGAREMGNATAYSQWLKEDFAWKRQLLLKQEAVTDARAADGAPLLDGTYDKRMVEHASGYPGTIPFTRPGLGENFTLAIKHHTPYTIALPELVALNHFKIIAVIRHPLDVISSWQTLNHSIAEGMLPIAEGYWPQVTRISESDGTALDRMAQIYEAFCQRYWELRDKIQIIKFEDVLANPAIVSRLLGGTQMPANAPLIERRVRVRKRNEADAILEKLKSSVFTRYFYTL